MIEDIINNPPTPSPDDAIQKIIDERVGLTNNEACRRVFGASLPDKIELTPHRLPTEPFDHYRARRLLQNYWSKHKVKGTMIHVSLPGSKPYVKAEHGPIGRDAEEA